MRHEKTRKQHTSLSVFLAVLTIMITFGCGKITSASDELIGIWKASDLRYKGTSFEIKKNEISFHTREGDTNSYRIAEIKKEMMQDRGWVIYTIFYLDFDLQKVEFPFYFRSSDSGMIRFKNQPYLVWKKESGIKT